MTGDIKNSIELRFRDRTDVIVKILKELYDSYMSIALIKTAVNQFTGGVDIVEQVEAELKATSNEKLIERFIDVSYDEWNEISLMDEKTSNEKVANYLLKLFAASPTSTITPQMISMFIDQKDTKGKKLIDVHVKKLLINQLTNCIKLSIKYIHNRRNPVQDTNSEYTYTSNYLDQVDLQEAIKKWNVTTFT